jgi:hypothetical protein
MEQDSSRAAQMVSTLSGEGPQEIQQMSVMRALRT